MLTFAMKGRKEERNGQKYEILTTGDEDKDGKLSKERQELRFVGKIDL